MLPIRQHPDDAGLVGALHLAPSWIFEGHDTILAVDIGGTNIRCGVVETRRKNSPDLSKASVWKSELWRHADDEPSREEAVEASRQAAQGPDRESGQAGIQACAVHRHRLSGVIKSDGSIEKGAELARQLGEQRAQSAGKSSRSYSPDRGARTAIVMHNDGVCRGCPKSLSCRT